MEGRKLGIREEGREEYKKECISEEEEGRKEKGVWIRERERRT